MSVALERPQNFSENFDVGTLGADYQEVSSLELVEGDEIVIYAKNTRFDPSPDAPEPIYEVDPNTVYMGVYVGQSVSYETGLYSATGTGVNSVKNFAEPIFGFNVKPKMLRMSLGGVIDSLTLRNKTIWVDGTKMNLYRIFRKRKNIDNAQPEVTDVDEA